jgi:hypothetical protein
VRLVGLRGDLLGLGNVFERLGEVVLLPRQLGQLQQEV